ncbi:MAG TPA: hypothetical protein VLJ11_20525 [Bryobacteraceae bacterium]|nr:hypothetical protein [Bryobacteraceae bacterium]
MGRHVPDAVHGILRGKRYLIRDPDPLFTAEFQDLLASIGVTAVKLPPQSPNLNAYAERFVRSIKKSCLDRLFSVWGDVVAYGGSRVRFPLFERAPPSESRQSADSS